MNEFGYVRIAIIILIVFLFRFEVLEQICASPQTLAHVVFEIQQRKRFKKEYTEV